MSERSNTVGSSELITIPTTARARRDLSRHAIKPETIPATLNIKCTALTLLSDPVTENQLSDATPNATDAGAQIIFKPATCSS